MDPRFDPMLLSRIEDASLNASAPTQQRWIDGWLVRFANGKAQRARCINAVGPGHGDLAVRLAACEQLYREVGLPLIFRITPFSEPAGLDVALERLGLVQVPGGETQVMVTALDAPLPPAEEAAAGAVTIHRVDVDAFAAQVGLFRGSPPAHCSTHAERLKHSPVPIHACELRVDGRPAACGQFALEGDIVGLYDVITAADQRGRGHAGMLCRHLLSQAWSRGARHAYLQVEGDNSAARSIYLRLGFADAYAYHYRQRPGPGSKAA